MNLKPFNDPDLPAACIATILAAPRRSIPKRKNVGAQYRARRRTSKSLVEIMALQPGEATVIRCDDPLPIIKRAEDLTVSRFKTERRGLRLWIVEKVR